jgi:hypothetical protein
MRRNVGEIFADSLLTEPTCQYEVLLGHHIVQIYRPLLQTQSMIVETGDGVLIDFHFVNWYPAHRGSVNFTARKQFSFLYLQMDNSVMFD